MTADRDRRTPTPLGRAVESGAAPTSREAPRKTNLLRDVILGGQDGLVNILGIILGVIAGGGSETVLIVAGFAAAITESISMGGSATRPRSPSATTTGPNGRARMPRSTRRRMPNGE
jgi:VIT family